MKRWHTVLLVVVAFLGMSIVVGYHVGVRLLQQRIVDALGPGSSITELQGELVFPRGV